MYHCSNYTYPADRRPLVSSLVCSEYYNASAALEEALDVEVIRELDVDSPKNRALLPVKMKRYKCLTMLYELANGKLLAFNENYDRGFNWIISGKARKKVK